VETINLKWTFDRTHQIKFKKKRRYQISGISFIRYAQDQKIGKPNKINGLGAKQTKRSKAE
jgi:hypothetical protein